MVALPGILRFLSTPSARRATAGHLHGPVPDWISIHALREEGDFSSHMDANRALNFYPRPPRGGRRDRHSKFKSITRFLSTPSARRATSAEAAANRAWQISIHALREEGDNSFQCSQSSRLDFYPRPPRGGRPYVAGYVTKKTYDFYPRPPRGGRLRHSSKLQQDKGYFYPRPPRGGRPSLAFSLLCNREISIHALREEGDGCSIDLGHIVDVFLSTPSARRATGESCHRGCRRDISIHALCEEGDLLSKGCACLLPHFYPRPLRGGRPSSLINAWRVMLFLSTPSARRATVHSSRLVI